MVQTSDVHATLLTGGAFVVVVARVYEVAHVKEEALLVGVIVGVGDYLGVVEAGVGHLALDHAPVGVVRIVEADLDERGEGDLADAVHGLALLRGRVALGGRRQQQRQQQQRQQGRPHHDGTSLSLGTTGGEW